MAYDSKYFEWQKSVGMFGGMANRFKFLPYLRNDDHLLDFGCGGGFLLNNLNCTEKAGIEVNPTARQQANSLGLTVYDSIAAVPDNFASLVISNHALEHVGCPKQALTELKEKTRKGCRLVFVVPHEPANDAWHPDDINQHLYTWNPMTLGNLFTHAGYNVRKVDTIRHRWPRHYLGMNNFLGGRLFHIVCKLEAYRTGNYQVRIFATNE